MTFYLKYFSKIKNYKLLFFILFFTMISFVHTQDTEYRCGIYEDHIPEIPAKYYIEKEPTNKRRADSEEFNDFHIYLDLFNLKNDTKKFNKQHYEKLYIDSMLKAIEILEALLKVKKPTKNFIFLDEEIKSVLIYDWNKTMIGNSSAGGMLDLGIDLILMARLDDKMGDSTIASAGSRFSDPTNGRPLLGVVNINTNFEYSKINSDHAFQTTILHEFTHVLGFSGSHFQNKFYNVFKRTDENGVLRQYINSSKVLEVARKYFNCPSIDGVELEESGGSGTVGSHWESRILLGDYMNGVTYYDEEVISEFTLALLEDTGYYKPYYYTGGLMRYGKGKGCDFVKNKCVNSGEINPKFENEFFDTFLSYYKYDSSCSSEDKVELTNFYRNIMIFLHTIDISLTMKN